MDFTELDLPATVGAALLLGPMWLMVLHNTLYTGLITTTVCVAVFGLVVASRLDKPMDVFSATAAYAAVFVVFMGLTTESSLVPVWKSRIVYATRCTKCSCVNSSLVLSLSESQSI